MDLIREAQALQGTIVEWRRFFHRHPELRSDTPVTSGKIEELLREIGIEEIRTGVGGSGVTATIRGGKPGKCLGIRADFDALPIREETGLPFAAKNGYMHACGHDAHTAMALGAAKLIFAHREELAGSVKLLFQPDEEGLGGAKAMIEDGALTDPAVDAVIALHTGIIGQKGTVSGDLSWHPQYSTFSSSPIRITVKGKSCHAAQPDDGHDALLCACQIVVALQSLLSRERDPGEQVILSINKMTSGVRHNVVSDLSVLEGTLRTVNDERNEQYFERICEIAEGIARAMRCEAEVVRTAHMRAVRNTPALTEVLLRVAPEIVGSEHIFEIKQMMAAGEDFAAFSDHVPTLYFFLSAAYGDERDYPHHNPRFNIDESNFWKGAALFAAFAFDWQN